MNKGILKIALISLVCAAMPASFTSCKNYDDDINNLQGQLDAVKVSVSQLQAKIDAGAVITSASGTGNGIVVTLSDGKSYTITNGNDGAPGTTWTIGDDGYWYKDGVKTDYRAIGQDGKDGQDGQNGQNGQDGKPGQDGQDGAQGPEGRYYVPNPTTGCFDIYKDGQFVESTTISWRASDNGGLTAVYTGNRLIISGGTDAAGNPTTVELKLGAQVGSIAFVPSVMSSSVAFPTTDKPFYHIASYLDESKYVASSKSFIPQGWDKSNNVHFLYRVNPLKAYIADNYGFDFINRVVVSRAAGDNQNLLNKVTSSYADGNFDVVATLNPSNLTSTGHNIAAAHLLNGQDEFVSDYVAVESTPIDVEIVRNKTKHYTVRRYAIPTKASETSAFIQNTCGVSLSKAADLQVTYTESVDLANEVALLCTNKNELVTNLDFDAPRYEFSLPAEYKSNDAQGTNQQRFAALEGSVLSVNTKELGSSITPAIGRTPVVRVDAYMNDNFGVEHMVASSYIKLEFVREAVVPGEEKDDIICEMNERTFNYSQLSDNKGLIGQLNWWSVNTDIYGKANLSADNFWNFYGGMNDEYEVVVSVVGKNGNEIELNPANKVAQANTPFSLALDGIFAEVTLVNNATQTSNIKFEVNNKAKTDETYKNVDNKGAKYSVTITIKSDNKQVKGDVIVKQVFYVLNDYQPYVFNPNYYNEATKSVRTKGKVANGKWVMQMNIEEAFEMKNGRDIFAYFADGNNVLSNPQIAFAFRNANHAGIAYGAPEFAANVLGLTAPMSVSSKTAQMQYTVQLKNTERMVRSFDVVFDNPFKAGNAAQVSLDGNKIGGDNANAASSVKVVDISGQNIYSWVNNSLALSSIAKDGYKLNASMVNVTYKFDETESDYKTFVGNLAPGTINGC